MGTTHQMFDEMGLKNRAPIPDVLYHYTTMDGLLGILETGKVWLTHVKYLNDSLEYEFLWQLLSNRINNRLGRSSNGEEVSRLRSLLGYRAEVEAFVASFSDDGGDRLSQWRGYCPGGSGFSIGIPGRLLEKFVTKHNDPRIVAPKLSASVVQIKYFSRDDEEKFDEIIDDQWTSRVNIPGISKERMFSALMSAFAWAYKHRSFEEEKEWRLTLASFSQSSLKPRDELSPAMSKILYDPEDPLPGLRFRSGKSMPIPFRESDLRSVDANFISTITIGPTPHRDLSKKAVQGLLHSSGVKACKVNLSDIPYRYW